MAGALFYLLFQSWKNRLTWRVRRMKQPKYLVGALAGALYFAYVCSFRFLFGHHNYAQSNLAIPGTPDLVFKLSVGSLILFVLAVAAWVVPHERTALVFTEAEVAFLFPAPVERRTLIHYKLIKSQMAILFTALIFTVVFGWARGGGAVWSRAIGWWVIFSTLNLHHIASSFARTMLLDRGISNWMRRVIVLTLAALVIVGLGVWAWRTLPPPPLVEELKGLTDIEYYIEQVLRAGPLLYVLYPFRIVVEPYLAPDATTFLKALGPALLLLVLHYAWVVRANVAFEEASVEASKRMAERVAAMRAGRQHPFSGKKKKKRAPFKLQPVGWPAIGLFWKNLIGAGSGFNFRTVLFIAWIVIVAGIAMTSNARSASLGQMGGMFAIVILIMSLFMGPQLVRQDFRHDLPMADLLKTYPLPAWQMAFGELLAPAAILAVVQWCLVLLAMLLLQQYGGQKFAMAARLAVGVSVAMLLPGLDFLTLLIPNAAVLLFPGWFQTGRDSSQGFEATGQRLIFALGQLVVLVLALVPAGLMFAMITLVLRVFGSFDFTIWLPAASAGATVVLAVEGFLGLLLLGRLFERFDVSSETAPG